MSHVLKELWFTYDQCNNEGGDIEGMSTRRYGRATVICGDWPQYEFNPAIVHIKGGSREGWGNPP